MIVGKFLCWLQEMPAFKQLTRLTFSAVRSNGKLNCAADLILAEMAKANRLIFLSTYWRHITCFWHPVNAGNKQATLQQCVTCVDAGHRFGSCRWRWKITGHVCLHARKFFTGIRLKLRRVSNVRCYRQASCCRYGLWESTHGRGHDCWARPCYDLCTWCWMTRYLTCSVLLILNIGNQIKWWFFH